MEDFSDIINWENLYKNSETFKKNKPVKFAFIEEFFKRDFYEKLYETYPKFDKTWYVNNQPASSNKGKRFNNEFYVDPKIHQEDDKTLSNEWNKLKQYIISDEFTKNVKKFCGISLKGVKYFSFIALHKGDFLLPHIDGDKTVKLNILFYFNKNWPKGDPGGTYISKKDDESSIIFEPYNLDNTALCFPPSTSKSWHGTRYITKDVRRQAMAIAFH